MNYKEIMSKMSSGEYSPAALLAQQKAKEQAAQKQKNYNIIKAKKEYNELDSEISSLDYEIDEIESQLMLLLSDMEETLAPYATSGTEEGWAECERLASEIAAEENEYRKQLDELYDKRAKLVERQEELDEMLI